MPSFFGARGEFHDRGIVAFRSIGIHELATGCLSWWKRWFTNNCGGASLRGVAA